ncbi:MAG TPA: FHA domain-containing protein [Myxococcaceae bacterium]|nr:FHA domain-containing protein [Myxococcaceae bacterium]
MASFYVRDAGSTNGTYFNGARVYELELPLNTMLRLGGAELCFEPVSQLGQLSVHGLLGKEPAMRLLVGHLERITPSDVTASRWSASASRTPCAECPAAGALDG